MGEPVMQIEAIEVDVDTYDVTIMRHGRTVLVDTDWRYSQVQASAAEHGASITWRKAKAEQDDPPTCIEGPSSFHLPVPDECDGAVHYRSPLSATGESFARCERHWSLRLQREEQLRTDYPDSATPPPWFDPAAAGEHWDSDY